MNYNFCRVQRKKILKDYQKSGDSSQLENTISDNISRFTGIHLQGLLHKIKITAIDLNRKIPIDYYQIDLQVNSEDLHKQAQEVLTEQSDLNKDYVLKIQDLYVRINSMSVYGTTLKKEDERCGKITVDLAEELKNDVDRFVVAHKNNLPSVDAYDKFKDEFSTRLHSEDSAMSKHRSSWKPIVANLFIGLFTVGIALGIKLIHSQITTKRCSFFFDKTERQEHLSAIEASVKTIEVVA